MFKSVEGGLLPQAATRFSAGFDVFANENMEIGVGETRLVKLGIAIDLIKGTTFEGYMFELHPRSSLRLKGIVSGVGIIDIDYKDEIKMIITNPSDRQEVFKIVRGDRIGQIVVKTHEGSLLGYRYILKEERTGGFGSTDQ